MFQLHGWEALLFYFLAFMTLIMAVFVATARAVVHSVLFLIGTLINIALLFILLRAEFVAGVQILIYAGAVMVLFLFVVMLVRTKRQEETKLYTGQAGVAIAVAALLAAAFYFAVTPAQGIYRPVTEGRPAVEVGIPSQAGAGSISKDTQTVAQALYTEAALPVEIVSLVLLAAMTGAVFLAKSRGNEENDMTESATIPEPEQPQSDEL